VSDEHDDFIGGDCPNCGGEGYIYCCEDEIGCVDPEGGCDLCMRRCDWCNPRKAAGDVASPKDSPDAK
jgi:hypothetical protein